MKISRSLLILAMAVFCTIAPSMAQKADANFDSNKFVAAIRKTKVLDAKAPIVVKRFPDAVVVTTLINPKAKVNDCKIDAMLVSKAVMDLDKTIHLVRYRLKYNIDADAFYLIVVKESDVKAYGASAINKDSLLAGLKVVARKGNENRLKNFMKRRNNL